MSRAAILSVLARSLLAGEPAYPAARSRAERTLGRRWRWLGPLARRFAGRFGDAVRPRHRDVVRFLARDAGFSEALHAYGGRIRIAEWLAEPQRMLPVEAALAWDLPVIETAGALAEWLGVTVDELDWFADRKDLCGRANASEQLRHYRLRLLAKRTGGARLTEAPKPRLKAVQRRILEGILDRVPPHPAAHGFVQGRSIVTFAEPHARRRMLLRLDLADFFPASPAARVEALFRTLGYPEAAAGLLAGLCTTATPRAFWRDCPAWLGAEEWSAARTLYARPQLPQGAPTSPALANAMAYRLDCRLAGLARSAGAVYTRYADDLAFSGDLEFARGVHRFAAHAAAVALEEGFAVNHRKTRIRGQGARQRLAGLVVNDRPNLPRRDLERLEAILVNCARRGPQGQNRAGEADFRAHLEGRVGYVEMVNPAKGERLRRILETIAWPERQGRTLDS